MFQRQKIKSIQEKIISLEKEDAILKTRLESYQWLAGILITLMTINISLTLIVISHLINSK